MKLTNIDIPVWKIINNTLLDSIYVHYKLIIYTYTKTKNIAKCMEKKIWSYKRLKL